MNDQKITALVVELTSALATSQDKTGAQVMITKYIVATVLFSVAAIIVGVSVSQVIRQYYKSIARQPEIKDALASNIYVFTGMIDAFAAIAVAAAFIILFSGTPKQLSVQELGQEVHALIQKLETNVQADAPSRVLALTKPPILSKQQK